MRDSLPSARYSPICNVYEELLQTLHQVPCSSGFSLNIGLLYQGSVTNVEVWPGGVAVTPVSGYSYHFNMLVQGRDDCGGLIWY